MILLKERADKDLQQHNAEMKELVRILDHDRKLKEFMGIKGQERQEDAELTAWRKAKEQKDAELKKETQENRFVIIFVSDGNYTNQARNRRSIYHITSYDSLLRCYNT